MRIHRACAFLFGALLPFGASAEGADCPPNKRGPIPAILQTTASASGTSDLPALVLPDILAALRTGDFRGPFQTKPNLRVEFGEIHPGVEGAASEVMSYVSGFAYRGRSRFGRSQEPMANIDLIRVEPARAWNAKSPEIVREGTRNVMIVRYRTDTLRMLAANRVLMHFTPPDNLHRGEWSWIFGMNAVDHAIQADPTLLTKIDRIELKRSGASGARVTTSPTGVHTLTVSYPSPEPSHESRDAEVARLRDAILAQTRPLPEKSEHPGFAFDRGLGDTLARHGTYLQVEDPESEATHKAMENFNDALAGLPQNAASQFYSHADAGASAPMLTLARGDKPNVRLVAGPGAAAHYWFGTPTYHRMVIDHANGATLSSSELTRCMVALKAHRDQNWRDFHTTDWSCR